MAYNTKSIVKDLNQKPIPQYYNPDTDSYEVLQGAGGANRIMIYDVDGNPVDLLEVIRQAINEMAYYGKSTDTKPTANVIKGSTFFEIDTGDVFMWDGTAWVVI